MENAFVVFMLTIFFVPIVIGTVYFVHNLLRTLLFNLRLATASKGESLDAVDHEQLVAGLPGLPAPAVAFDRAHGRIRTAEVPEGGVAAILYEFEKGLVEARDKRYFFARLDGVPKSTVSSALVGFRASRLTRFFTWAEIEDFGTHYEWRLRFSETRLLRTPNEENSHFQYSESQHARYDSADASGSAMLVWDLLFSNVTTQGMGRRAEYFEQRIKEAFIESLAGSAPRARRAPPGGRPNGNPGDPAAKSDGMGPRVRPASRI